MERQGSGGHSDTDTDSGDETVVEGSVAESDVEEEEFCRKRWLAFLNKDMALTTEINIDKGAFSPEIGFTQKSVIHTHYHRAELINPVLQEAYISDQSQSLLKDWINHLSPTENISKPGFSLNSAAEEQQNNSIDIKLNGFQKDSEEMPRRLSNKDCFPEESLCLHDPVEDVITFQKEQTPEDTFPHVLDNCRKTCMTIIDTDNRAKEHSLNNDTDLSLSSPGKIFMGELTEQNIETSKVDISNLLRYPSDSESLKVKNPLPDKLECQGHASSIDPSAAESSDALPVEPVVPLNALSGSMVQAATPAVANERQLNAKEEQLNSEASVLQVDDDCTQITNVMEPPQNGASSIQMEEINAFTGFNLQSAANEQPVGGQQAEKEVISHYLDATFSERQTGELHSYSVEPAVCAETAQTTSSKIQKSTSKDKQDLEAIIWQEIILNEYAEANQRRRSKRIDIKQRREAFGRNSINPTRPLSLSTIHRRNAYGENLLHRAVTHQDINLVRRIIKAGGNVNAQDYAGLTALHIASMEGYYGIANLLLKAGADVNATQKEQITPLQDAVKEGHYEVANLLLWYGADPLLKNHVGRCALDEASNPSMMKLLKSYVAKSRRRSVAGGGDSKSVLNTQCVEDTNQHQSSLQTGESEQACANPQKTSQKAKAASYFSSSNNKVSSNQSQLSQASEQQTSKKSESTREEAVIVHGTHKKRAGRKTKIRRNATGETRLHIAAKRGDVSLVKTLISSGICVNEQDYAGWTAIHEASNGGFTDVILELLKAGADVNSRSLCGVLPIHDAVSGNYLEAARILLQHGANPNERNGSGESALNQACSEEMKELLKSYGAMDSVPVQTVEVSEVKSKHHCYDCHKNDDTALETQHENYSVESVAAVQDTEKKQEELLLFELRTSKDADVYIRRLSQIQDNLNEILVNQKTERDTLAKKYRASVESFKKGALRKQLVYLASRQKSLLTVAQNQEKLVQKIQNFRKTKLRKNKIFNSSSEKQISDLVIFHGSDARQSLTANEIICPNAVTFSMGLDASMPNGNRVEAHVSLENRFSARECIQHPHICLNETGANKEAIARKEASDCALASENWVRDRPFDNMSKLTNAAEVMTLPSEPFISTAKTKCSKQKDIDCVAIVGQRSKSLNPTSNTLNIVEPLRTVGNRNVYQTTSDCKQVLSHEDLHRYVNKKEALQQQQPQQAILLASTKNFSNTLQQMVFQSGENSFNANPMLTNLTSNTDSPANTSKKSSQSYANQEWEQKQVAYGWKSKKKHELIDLLELGRIKPGENVLEFKLQEFSHKATLLKNGKIRTSRGQILQNPVQWVKDLLGSGISVTRNYVWNKALLLSSTQWKV
ncbi:ankyrin repeat domain-containing protein 31 isoform 2-T2 [Acridotheres tristis]